MSRPDPRERVERMTARLLAENTKCRAAWDKHDPSAGDRARATKLSPEDARKRAEKIARRNEED